MARIYQITEPEMQGLMDQLQLQQMVDKNMLIHPTQFEALAPEERNRLSEVHRAFHMVCVRWAQSMGFNPGQR